MKKPNIIVKSLIWDKWNREHIGKHNLTPRQVEQTFQDKYRFVGRGYAGRIKIYGRCGKRLIVILLAPEGKKYYVVSSRDMDKKERKIYRNNL